MNANHLPTTQIATTAFSIFATAIYKTKSIALLMHSTTSQHPADAILVHSVATTVMIHCCVYKISFQLYSDFNYIIVTEFSVYSSIDWKHQMPVPVPISRCMILNTQHSRRYSKLWLNNQFSKESISCAIPLQSSFIVMSIPFAMNFFLTRIVHPVRILDINLIFEKLHHESVYSFRHITNQIWFPINGYQLRF